jgi:hypothetical protein
MVDAFTKAPLPPDQPHGQAAASWSAIFAGAFVAVSVSLVLITLGSGIGLAAISPWAGHGASATGFSIAAIIWLIVTQWISAAFGGYIAGRLRRRWLGTHTHEIFFRDTAHGLVTWSVATAFSAFIFAMSLASTLHAGTQAASAMAGAGAKAAAGAVTGRVQNNGMAQNNTYSIDKLLRRSDATSSSGGDSQAMQDPRPEVGAILANAATTGAVPDEDRTYLSQLVASQTGLSPADAQKVAWLRLNSAIWRSRNRVTPASRISAP